MTDPDGRAGQLTARVQVNRVWHHLIGQGIVRTVDNFGRTGESPSHPQLLDYLALQLIDSNWSLKRLVRQIALSRTFALSSRHAPDGYARDPENRLLWHAHRRRLDPESLRDAMLAIAGQLDLTPRESTVWYLNDQATAVGANEVRRRTDFPCRSVYLPVIRNDLPELFEVFDFADPHVTTGARPRTTVPTQGLYLLNNEMVMDAALATAKRVLGNVPATNSETGIDAMYQLILGQDPTDQQREAVRTFLRASQQQLQAAGESEAELRALSLVCHALLSSSQFQFLE
jgi:hypothetical protein